MNSFTEPDHSYPSGIALIAEIRSHVEERVNRFMDISSRLDYLEAAQTFPDVARELFVLLERNDLDNHQHLWLILMERLSAVSLSIARAQQTLRSSIDPEISGSASLLLPVLLSVCNYLRKFFSSWNMDLLTAGDQEAQEVSRDLYLHLLVSSNDLQAMGQVVKGASFLESVAYSVGTYLEGHVNVFFEDPSELSQLKCQALQPLVSFAKAAFFSGHPECVLPLVFERSVDETYIPAVLRYEFPEVNDIIDFYRYFGYCLTTVAVTRPEIDDQVTNKADIFLKVLLGMPNLQASNWMGELLLDNPEAVLRIKLQQHVSALEREELSLYYLINHLLRMRSLAALVYPDTYFRSEIWFFVKSLNRRVSSDLDMLALAAHSTTSSMISIHKLESPEIKTDPNSRTISSILHLGTYKEKLRLVLEFFTMLGQMDHSSNGGNVVKLVQTFSFSEQSSPSQRHRRHGSASDLTQIVRRIDRQKYPGKVLFLDAVSKIVKLCQLLTINYQYSSARVTSNPDSILALLFKSDPDSHSIMLIKNLLRVVNNKVEKVPTESKTEETAIMAQFRLLEMTHNLDDYTQKLL